MPFARAQPHERERQYRALRAEDLPSHGRAARIVCARLGGAQARNAERLADPGIGGNREIDPGTLLTRFEPQPLGLVSGRNTGVKDLEPAVRLSRIPVSSGTFTSN